MNDLPRSELGGSSPVVAYLRHSMIVCDISMGLDSLGKSGTHSIPFYRSR